MQLVEEKIQEKLLEFASKLPLAKFDVSKLPPFLRSMLPDDFNIGGMVQMEIRKLQGDKIAEIIDLAYDIVEIVESENEE